MPRIAVNDARYLHGGSSPDDVTIVTAYAFADNGAPAEAVVERLAERAATIGALRQRVVQPYGQIGDPHWSEEPGFDPRDHIVIEDAADWAAIRRVAVRARQTALDRTRPLWRLHLAFGVDGVAGHPGGCLVVVLVIHHCMTDGMGAGGLVGRIFARVAAPADPRGPRVSRVRATATAVCELPLRPFAVLADVGRFAHAALTMKREMDAGLWSFPPRSTAATALNGPIGARRANDALFLDVRTVRAAAREIGDVTVNDVVLAVIGRALADHLGDPHVGLVAAVPVSARSAAPEDERTAVIGARVDLHTTSGMSTAERVTAIHDTVQSERRRVLSPSHVAGARATPRFPGFVYAAVAAIGRRRARRPVDEVLFHTTITTVRMRSAEDWDVCGMGFVANFVAGFVEAPCAVIHTVSVIGDAMTVSVTVDADRFTDFDDYLCGLRDGFAEATAAVDHPADRQSPRRT